MHADSGFQPAPVVRLGRRLPWRPSDPAARPDPLRLAFQSDRVGQLLLDLLWNPEDRRDQEDQLGPSCLEGQPVLAILPLLEDPLGRVDQEALVVRWGPAVRRYPAALLVLGDLQGLAHDRIR